MLGKKKKENNVEALNEAINPRAVSPKKKGIELKLTEDERVELLDIHNVLNKCLRKIGVEEVKHMEEKKKLMNFQDMQSNNFEVSLKRIFKKNKVEQKSILKNIDFEKGIVTLL